MLVLSRKKNESVQINGTIIVTIVEIRGDKVRLGIEAPRDVTVHRSEIAELLAQERIIAPPQPERPQSEPAYG